MTAEDKIKEIKGRQITNGQVAGRTIARLEFNPMDEMTIVFSNGEYVVFRSESCYDSDPAIVVSDYPLDAYDMKTLGLLSEEEYNQAQEVKKQQRLSEAKQREYNQYLRLKKEFGEIE